MNMTKQAKKFKCLEKGCGKSFHRRDYLTRHQANHKPVKPFCCVQCQLQFSRRDVLEKHYRSKTHENRRNQITANILHVKEENAERGPSAHDRVLDELKEAIGSDLNSPLNASIDWLFGDFVDMADGSSEMVPVIDNTPPMRECDSGIPLIDLEESRIGAVLEILRSLGLNGFSLERHPTWIDNFGKFFIPIYPLIHQPTFNANTINIWLLIAIMSIGMAFSMENSDHEAAIRINKEMKFHVFREIDEESDIDLELLQALLLNNFCCKLLGSSRQIKGAQVYHGTSINFLRIGGYFNKTSPPDVESGLDADATVQESLWRDWIRWETCKRTAFFGFILDCQNASLFRDLQVMSIFEIHLELPSSDSLWNAKTPSVFFGDLLRQPKELNVRTEPVWKQENDGISKEDNSSENNKSKYSKSSIFRVEMEGAWPSFLWSLRRLMQPFVKFQKDYHMNCFSQFSRLILLHGVFNITWDLKSRSLLDLGLVSKKSLSLLLGRLNLALRNWKGYFEKQTKMSNSQGFESTDGSHLLNDYGVSNLFWNSVTIYQFFRIALNADLTAIIDYQTEFVRMRGKTPTSSGDRLAATRQQIQFWTRTPDSRRANNAACKTINNIANNIETAVQIPYLARTLYYACLTIWAYETNVDLKITGEAPEGVGKVSKEEFFSINGTIDTDVCKKHVDIYLMSVLADDSYEHSTDSKDIHKYYETQKQVLGLLIYTTQLLGLFDQLAARDLGENLASVWNLY